MTNTEELPVLTIRGSVFDDFEGFVTEFSRLLDDWEWNSNLDAFNDILRGGFGTPLDGFELQWFDSARSREMLGYPAIVKWLEAKVKTCHPSNVSGVEARLANAKLGVGITLFDWLVEIIEDHGPGGSQADDNVHLKLL